MTTEEKIDYIYTTLKKQESRAKFQFAWRLLFKVFIVLYIIYLYKVTLPGLKEDLFDKITPTINIEDSETLDTIKEYINKF